MGNPTQGAGGGMGSNFNAGDIVGGTEFGSDPFTSGVNSGNVLDDPSSVVGDPFFDPMFGSMAMGGDQTPPGQGSFGPDPNVPREQSGGAQQPEPQPTSAAGGPRADPAKQGSMFGEFAPALKQLAKVIGGGQPQGPTAQGGGGGGGGGLANFLSGGMAGRRPAPQQNQPAPQGTEGGGAPATASPPTAAGAPPSMPQDTATAMAPRPPQAAFPTTMA